jgi:ribokinase
LRGELFVIGSCNLDLQLHIAQLPRPGETIPTLAFARSAGGKGANQAAAAARLGAAVAMLGAVGHDDAGAFLMESLRAAGVDTEPILRLAEPTGTAAILLTGDGQNSIVLAAGANGMLTPAHVRDQATRIAQASYLLTQLETSLAVLDQVLSLAAQTDIPVLLDPAPATRLSGEALRQVAWFTPNATEAGFYLSRAIRITEGADALDCLHALHALGPRNILLKLGEQGACVLAQESAYWVRAPRVHAVDTTGAGDTMNAALAVALSRGRPASEALRFAVAAATCSVLRAGAMDAAPTLEEVSRFLAKPDFPEVIRLH